MKNTTFSRGSSLSQPCKHYSSNFFNKYFILLIIVAFVAGCKKVSETEGLKGICPEVSSTNPANTANNINLDAIVEATFNEEMNPSTINAVTYTVSEGTTPVAGVITYSGSTATFTPTENFIANTTYNAMITSGAQDPAGNAMIDNYSWSFTTGPGPDIIAPFVTLTDPLNFATGVLLDKIISVTFSEIMDSLSATSSFTLANTTVGGIPVSGTVTYSQSIAVFTPSVELENNTTYTGTISITAKDASGNPMISKYNWSFTTAQVNPTIPPLGTILVFGVFGGNAGITNEGLNTIINNGGIGTTAASTLITGFHDGMTNDIYTETPLNVGNATGGIYSAPPAPGTATSFDIALQGLVDATILYNSISPASKPGGIDPGAGELGGLTLAPGIYKSASGTFKITNGDLTLDAQGNPNAVWIFQTASGLTVGTAGPAGARSVHMINGGLPKNVFWYVGSAAVINGAGGGVMVGTIISSAGVTLSTSGNETQTVLNGRAISLNASVTMVNTTINVQ